MYIDIYDVIFRCDHLATCRCGVRVCVCLLRALAGVCVWKEETFGYLCVRPVRVLPTSFLYLFVSSSKKKKATIKSLILIKPSCCCGFCNLAHTRPHWLLQSTTAKKKQFFIGLRVVLKQRCCSAQKDPPRLFWNLIIIFMSKMTTDFTVHFT